MSEENVEIVRRAYAAFNRTDLKWLAELVSPDWVMDWSQSIGPLAGVYRDLEGAAAWIAAIQEAFEDFELTPTEYIGSGARIVVRARVRGRGRGSGLVVDAAGTTLWELRGGKVTNTTLYQSDEEALEAAGLTE
jgi:ketosteroid isomerase-like protein